MFIAIMRTEYFQGISACFLIFYIMSSLHTGPFSLVILAAVAARQHSPSLDRLGPTRARADFTDFKKTALSHYPNNLGS